MSGEQRAKKQILLRFVEIGVFGGEGIGVRIFINRSRKESNWLKRILSCNVSNERSGGQKRRISEIIKASSRFTEIME